MLKPFVRTEEFDEQYYYPGNDLGNVYSETHTSFRVWAPTASDVKLVTYADWEDEIGIEIDMERSERGTWRVELQGNQDGLIYTYRVKVDNEWNEAVDPYVRATTINGEKGVVVDLQTTNPEKWDDNRPKLERMEDTIIYELHIRDLSIHPQSGMNDKGKFLALTELNTTGPYGVSTGLNYIRDLGVTHIQLLPMADFYTVDEQRLEQAQYNWGYDPKNYNVPDGSYSTNPYDPKVRIREMKQMIQAIHDQGLRVIMDVVYNHVYIAEKSNFQAIVPGYYFRYNEDGTLSNGTGVGNDTASERSMMRKFIVDSVSYWAREYHIDGFRFDLMGIHDIVTMNEVRQALNKIDPSIIVLGEGWDMNTPIPRELKASQQNAEKMPGTAHFNDRIRDAIKGNVFDAAHKGFINGGEGFEGAIKSGVMGKIEDSLHLEPKQVITYAEVHDNYTIWDKLLFANPHTTREERIRMHKLATAIILTSQGIPFIHAGQEFMRTKGGDANSYQSPDSVNQLDWNRRKEFDEEVEYVKGLVRLRKRYQAFRMSHVSEIQMNLSFLETPSKAVAYLLTDVKESCKLMVIYNANIESITLPLPYEGIWQLLVNERMAGVETLDIIVGNEVTVKERSCYVLKYV